MRALAAARGLDIATDSAGTGGWHAGDPPDRRAVATAARHGVDISDLRARQLTVGDFAAFDRIVAMDADNLAHADAMRPAGAMRATISLLLAHCGRTTAEVGDPYYGDGDGFERCWADIVAGVEGLATEIEFRGR